MGRKAKLTVTLTIGDDGLHIWSWQDESSDCSQPLSRIVTVREIKSEFPKFCKAVTESYSLLNPAVELNEFILCAAYSYAENVMKRKRF